MPFPFYTSNAPKADCVEEHKDERPCPVIWNDFWIVNMRASDNPSE